MTLSLIVAMSINRVIGRSQKLPWHLPEDLRRFKQITSGHPVVMGRKTFESIGKPLPGRTNIVVSRDKNLTLPGTKVVHSIHDALSPYDGTQEEVFILGGGEIFEQTLDRADKLYLTLIEEEVEGDTTFPAMNLNQFDVVFEERHSRPLSFVFKDYVRKKV